MDLTRSDSLKLTEDQKAQVKSIITKVIEKAQLVSNINCFCSHFMCGNTGNEVENKLASVDV